MANWWNEVKSNTQATQATPSTDWWSEAKQPNDLLQKAERGEVPSIGQGKPGFMENVTSNVSPVDESSKMAGIGTQAAASFPTDLKERAGYFAKQRFPNDPNAISKYGVQDGRIFYEGDDGKYYFEEPSAKLGQMGKYLASGVGGSLPTAGSIIGGVATAELGGVPGAAAGAVGGDAIRQSVAQSMGTQEGYKPLQAAGEAVTGAAGQAVGVGVGKGLSWNAAKDLSTIQTPEAKAAIKELEAKAAEYGYTLTAAEKTNLQSLISKENTLGSLPESGNVMRKFYQDRTENQAPAAAEKALSDISPTQSAEVGAKNFQEGAQNTIKDAVKTRQEAASPIYHEVYPKKVAPNQLTSIQNSNPLIKNAIASAADDDVVQFYANKYQQETGKTITPNSVGFLDAVKQSLDGKAESAIRAGDSKRANAYSQSAEQLRTMVDSFVPQYAEARAAYAGESPAVEALKTGEVGIAANKKPTQLLSTPTAIFKSGKDSIAKNREAFVKAGQEDAWNDGLRAHLQTTFDNVSSKALTPEASYKDAVFAKGGKERMKAAMTQDQWLGFNRFMDVMEAAGRVPKGGSRTAFAGEGIAGLKTEAGGATSKILRALNPANLVNFSKIADFLDGAKVGQYSKELAEITTSPDNMQQLKALKGLNPGSKKAVNIVSQLIDRQVVKQATQSSDVVPGGFSDKSGNQQ